MHLEFAYILRNSLVALAEQSGCSAVERVLQLIDVEDPPAVAQAELATSVAFRLAILFRKNGLSERYPDPQRVAEIVCELAASEKPLFKLWTSGLGHINADRSAELIEGMLRRLLATGVDALFSAESMFESGESIVVEPLVAPDWDYQLMKARNDEDTSLFLKRCGSELSAEDRLLFLALQGDPELDLKPYLSGLASRQNVPWYVKKFSRDWRAYIGALKIDGGVDASQQLAYWVAATRCGTSHQWTPEQFLASVAEIVCSLRKHTVLAPSPRRPVSVVAALLSTIRLFYAFYNHPDNRRGDFAPVTGATIARAIQLLGEVVERGFSCLELDDERSVSVRKEQNL